MASGGARGRSVVALQHVFVLRLAAVERVVLAPDGRDLGRRRCLGVDQEDIVRIFIPAFSLIIDKIVVA